MDSDPIKVNILSYRNTRGYGSSAGENENKKKLPPVRVPLSNANFGRNLKLGNYFSHVSVAYFIVCKSVFGSVGAAVARYIPGLLASVAAVEIYDTAYLADCSIYIYSGL